MLKLWKKSYTLFQHLSYLGHTFVTQLR